MNIYGELDSRPEHRSHFDFIGKRENKAKVNISNLDYPNEHICNEIRLGSSDHEIVRDTVKFRFILEIESTKNICLIQSQLI